MTGDLEVVTRHAAGTDLPNFIVIGAMKAGTTSLYHYLKQHHQVFMPTTKELDFFAAESNWRRGLGWYRRQFSAASDAVARGEASPLYTQYPTHDGVPERIARVLPGVRLIYVVRDPVVRIRSHYQHRVMTGAEKSPPDVAVLENPIYLDCSRYSMQLERYLAHFPREQILVVTSERLRFDRRATLREVYEFLGVDPTHVPDVIDTEFYRTAGRRTYPPVVLWARRCANRHMMLQGRLPRAAVKKMLAPWATRCRTRKTAPASPEATEHLLSPGVRAELAARLSDDVARLRSYMPPDFDGWGYA